MIELYKKEWNEVATAWIDTETTGIIPGLDGVCQVAVVRFENGEPVGKECLLINPGRNIPETATAIHGITDSMVKDAPTILEFFGKRSVQELLAGAQPGAYNAPFDRAFLPLWLMLGAHWSWPWIDPLVFVRTVDRYESGQGRHKLENACARRKIALDAAHSADADAEACGRLFYKIVPETKTAGGHLGHLLSWQRKAENEEWRRFNDWLSKQPPLEPVDVRPAFDREARA